MLGSQDIDLCGLWCRSIQKSLYIFKMFLEWICGSCCSCLASSLSPQGHQARHHAWRLKSNVHACLPINLLLIQYKTSLKRPLNHLRLKPLSHPHSKQHMTWVISYIIFGRRRDHDMSKIWVETNTSPSRSTSSNSTSPVSAPGMAASIGSGAWCSRPLVRGQGTSTRMLVAVRRSRSSFWSMFPYQKWPANSGFHGFKLLQ